MNHFLATYIDFVQSAGFILLTTMAVLITRKLFLDNKKDIDKINSISAGSLAIILLSYINLVFV